MNDVKYIILNNKEYLIIDEIPINNVTYLYLVSDTNEEDFLIQKILLEQDQEYLTNISSIEEYNKALIAFKEKHTSNA